MQTNNAMSVLNRLFQAVYRSLPMYLAAARNGNVPDGQKDWQLLRWMAADHQTLATRIAEAIRRHGGVVDFGRFPLEFTSMNDLDVKFLVRLVLEHLERDIPVMQRCLDRLAGVPSLQPVAENALRIALEHQAAIKDTLHRK